MILSNKIKLTLIALLSIQINAPFESSDPHASKLTHPTTSSQTPEHIYTTGSLEVEPDFFEPNHKITGVYAPHLQHVYDGSFAQWTQLHTLFLPQAWIDEKVLSSLTSLQVLCLDSDRFSHTLPPSLEFLSCHPKTFHNYMSMSMSSEQLCIVIKSRGGIFYTNSTQFNPEHLKYFHPDYLAIIYAPHLTEILPNTTNAQIIYCHHNLVEQYKAACPNATIFASNSGHWNEFVELFYPYIDALIKQDEENR